MENGTITIAQLCEREGLERDQMRYKWNKNFAPAKFSAKTLLTTDQVELLLSGKKPEKKPGILPEKIEFETRPLTPMKPKNLVENSEKTYPKSEPKNKNESEKKTVLILSICITVISVCLTITGLFVFASWAGAMLGAMFSLFLFAAVWVARNRMKGVTSEKALDTVWKLETGAAVLHFFTFWRLLVIEEMYVKGAACLFLSGFVAYLSYSAVLTVRNYNAEV